MARFDNPNTGSGNTGDITFAGVQIIGSGTASGDGANNGTIELVPDGDIVSDQYLIIDPTAPNHIHIRAGGIQDASSADVFLGGERNNVRVSDNGRSVSVSVRPDIVVNSYINVNQTSNADFITDTPANIYIGDPVFRPVEGGSFIIDSVTYNSPSAGLTTVTASGATFTTGNTYIFTHEEPWDYAWTFDSNGLLSGPAMGLLAVNGLYSNTGYDLGINSTSKVTLYGETGEFLNDSNVPTNQIATLGDIPTGATGSFTSADNKTITVTDGIITAITPI